MSEKDPITHSLRILTTYFEKKRIPYVIVGGIGVLIYGRIRATSDVDIIIDHTKLDIGDFIRYLRKNGFSNSESDLTGLKEKTHCSFFLNDSMFRIDLKGVYSTRDKEALTSYKLVRFKDLNLRVVDPMYLVLNKLLHPSEQDYEDAIAVFVKKMEEIDVEKMRRKAQEMGIKTVIDSFLKEIKELMKKENNPD